MTALCLGYDPGLVVPLLLCFIPRKPARQTPCLAISRHVSHIRHVAPCAALLCCSGCWAEEECEQLGKCCWMNRTMPHNLGVLAAYAKKRGGKMVVVPDAEHNVAYDTGCGTKPGEPRCACPVAEQQFKASIDRKYYDWCAAEPLCVAMLPFLWNTVHTSKYAIIGATDQHVLLETLTELGTKIKRREVVV